MVIVGLTGSIATGKSTIARIFARAHIPICDADAIIHQLIGPKGRAVTSLLDKFGDVGSFETGIDRAALGAVIFAAPDKRRALEALLHPLVAEARERFLKQMRARYQKAVILDVPLLFETGTDALCDVTITSWAPAFLIRQRALARPHMTEDKLNGILAAQLSQFEKKQRADIAIATGLGYFHMMRQLKPLIAMLQAGHLAEKGRS